MRPLGKSGLKRLNKLLLYIESVGNNRRPALEPYP